MPDLPGSDLPGALAAIRSSVVAANPQLYRHLALYLQVLRDSLPHKLEQACFHLATRLHPGRYVAMDPADRQHLHQRIRELVQQCSCLLTVEQLSCLAAQMARENGRRRRQAQRRLLESLAAATEAPGASSQDPERPEAPFPVESGLGVAIPIPLRLRLVEGPGRPGGSNTPEEDAETPRVDGASDDEGQEHDPVVDGDPADPAIWQLGRLPDDPVLLLRWLDGMEQALQRRLRNLSHAINVELLRAGLSSTLLPVSLLDAALHGRVDSAPAPPHLLLMPLPFTVPGLSDGVPAMALLLRKTDLELEEPRLRTCQRRLQQHRQELRRMADRFRRLQRRLQIHRAERLWLQDHPPLAPKPD